jgi:hypothetical protein
MLVEGMKTLGICSFDQNPAALDRRRRLQRVLHRRSVTPPPLVRFLLIPHFQLRLLDRPVRGHDPAPRRPGHSAVAGDAAADRGETGAEPRHQRWSITARLQASQRDDATSTMPHVCLLYCVNLEQLYLKDMLAFVVYLK